MDQSQKEALLTAILTQGTLSKACVALGLDRRAVSRARQDDATLNARVLAAVATARYEYRERHGGEDAPEDSDDAQDSVAAIVPAKVDDALPSQSLINVPGQREPLPYHDREAQRVGLPPGAPPISGEEPKVQTEAPGPYRITPGAAADLDVVSREEREARHGRIYEPLPPSSPALLERPADLYPPQPEDARDFPPAVWASLKRFYNRVRADPTYARNIQVRFAMMEGGDDMPLGDVIRTMMEA